MKRYVLLPTLSLIMLLCCAMQQSKQTKVVFFGDSITFGATKPTGFISILRDSLVKEKMEESYELIGAGISGNHVYDLAIRMEHDVLAKNPDVVVVFIGVNDIWHKAMDTGTSITQYEKYYSIIIEKLKEADIQIILCPAALIGEHTDYTNKYDGDLNAYAKVVYRLADKYGCRLVDFRKIFQQYNIANNIKNLHHGVLTTDGVHFNDDGNKLAAKEIFKVLIQKP